ncbi:DUF3558 family protein [Peterkaempfera bronchialis]|uniref:DUF3558 domain-containing protein n=1 Tax=Peterkaempfera bronchialis TaxID=2126346 RepID=A0A345SW24_9ACTN|nr:DUF3558 family protein [Peterkaempfera bronchialis]AXI77929.1 DUF3558 domain-containing protein [Peterkaempfera bronchialis]
MSRTRIRPPSPLLPLAVLVLAALAGCTIQVPSTGGKPAATAPESVAPKTAAPESVTPETAAPETTAPESAAPAEVDPCTLVSPQEARKLAGTPLNPATRVADTCTYTAPVDGPTAQLEIYVGDGAKKYLDIDRSLEHAFRPLPGVADEAYAEEDAVFLRRSDRWVAIHLVRLNDPAENRAPMEELARKVADRI